MKIAENAKLTLISDEFSFTEGAATDKDGNVFFTDQPNDNIWKFSTDGRLSLFITASTSVYSMDMRVEGVN